MATTNKAAKLVKKPAAKKVKKITKKSKNEAIEKDVGILTKDINNLAKHLGGNPGDDSSRSGLLRKLSRRKYILRGVSAENKKLHEKLVKNNKLVSAN